MFIVVFMILTRYLSLFLTEGIHNAVSNKVAVLKLDAHIQIVEGMIEHCKVKFKDKGF